MAKLPCPPQSRIYTLKDTGETMSYDQVREYLMSNPELWLGKGEAKEIKKEEKSTEFGKALSASSRFKPKELVVFDTPIVGPNGNKLVAYQWAYEWTMKENKEGELVDKRISDWTQAESSAETGRDVVHKFTVQKTDGSTVTVSSETIPSLLGYVDAKQMKGLPSVVSAVKTLAKQRMQLAIMEAQEAEYKALEEKFEKADKPEVKEVADPAAERFGINKEGEFTTYGMGDVSVRQDNRYNWDTKKFDKVPLSRETIKELERKWVLKRIEEAGGKYPSNITDLRNRVKRQERRVEEATNSKITIKEQEGEKAEGKRADPVIEALDKGKIKGVAGMNAAVWNATIDAIKAAYLAGKSVAEAINEGIAYLKSKGEEVSKYQDALDDIRKAEKPRVATFFSGAGTMEAALPKSESVMAVEYSPTYMKAYNDAFGTEYEARDVTQIDPQEVKAANPNIFHASPVCKNFSKAKNAKTVEKSDMDSAEAVARVIREAKPPVVTIENVPGYKDTVPFEAIIKALEDAGYTYDVGVYNAADYGGVQNRKRLLVRAVKDGKLPALPKKQKPGDWYKAVEDLIDDAPDAPFTTKTKEKNWEQERIDEMIADERLDPSKPIITMGASAYQGEAAAANSGNPSPTLLSSSNQVPRIIMPDGRIKRVTPEMMKRLMDLPLSYPVPVDAKVAKEVLGNGMDGAFTKALIEPLIKQLSPEQELKQAFDKWKSETGKLGIVPNWERQAKADIELFNAAKKYLLTKIGQGAYAFEQFLKDLAKAKVENIDEDRSKWKKFYNDTIKEAAPAEEGKATTPPPPVTPPPPTGKREMPEGEGKETEKPILGRAFRGTTDEALAEKLAKMGLYRKPASIEEADKIGAETVALMGVDKAIELGVKGDVPNGFVRMGIFKAILADLKKQRDALVIKEGPAGEQAYMDALDEINDKRAEAMAAFSPSVTAAGQILRGFQEIIRNEEFEFDYEFRKDNFKTLFGDEAYTKEIDERFKEYDKKLKDAAKKRKELENRIAELEAQGIVDNINQEKKTSPVSFFKQAAERVRKLKFSRPGMFSAATPATLAWDATIEAVAVVLDASGTLEQAIVAGIKKLKTTDWYKSLTDAKKSAAENEVAKYVKDGYILKATIDEDGIIQIPSGLLRSYVTAGINDAQAIIDDMLSYLKEADSEITASDVRTAILEAGKREAPTQNQITQSVNDLKSIIRMLGQLEKIRAGERITKNEGKKKQMRDAVANLKKTIEDKHLEVFGTKPGALTDEQRLANIKKNAQKRINDLRAMKPRPEVRERVKWDAEMEALANEEFRLKEKWDDEFAQARYKKLSDWQKFGRGAYLGINLSKTVMSGMTDLGIILIQGATLPFRSAKLTAKALANMAKVILSHDEFVRQQRVINESDLYRVARKSNLDMPQVSGMEIDKLEESSLGAFGEKAFDVLFKPFDYIPKVGPKMYEWAKKHINIPRVLNRMQTSYLNTLRYGTFALSARSLMEKGITYQNNPQAYKDVAEAINTMSGRTKIGAENSPAVMRFLNLVFYSPKNAMSLLKIYTPYVLIEIGKKRAEASGFAGMSEAQQTMIRTLAGAIAIPSALYLMMKALTGWDEEDEEEKKKEGNVSLDIENPQSSAFAKIRIGNQLFDPWGGRAQLITLQARLIIHYVGNGRAYKDPYTGIEKRLSEVQRFKHPVGLAGEYIKGKFSPYARAAFTLGTSEQVKGKRWYVRRPLDGGKEFDILDPIKESYTNITYESVKELYGNQPLTVSEIMTLFLIAGGGVTTLNNQDEQSILTKVREKLSPEEDERRKFAKNLASYIKDENMIGAEEVYDQAIGVKGNEKKSELITKRREHADKLFSSAKKDGIASKWTIDVEDRPKVFALLYKNEPIKTTSRTKEEKKVVYDAYNNLTPEEKAEIKFDYEMEYEELINIAKGLDHLNKTPGKYLKEVNQVEWVKEYKKATGKK